MKGLGKASNTKYYPRMMFDNVLEKSGGYVDVIADYAKGVLTEDQWNAAWKLADRFEGPKDKFLKELEKIVGKD